MLELDSFLDKDLIECIDRESVHTSNKSSTRVISITSGKGGVGKSSVVINLGIALAKKGNRVLILDGDFGLANLDILTNSKADKNLFDVLYKEVAIQDVITTTNFGIDIIPASSGIFEMTEINDVDRLRLLDCFQELESKYDILLIDTAAGINSDVIWLNASAAEVYVVVTPEPTSITDAYAMIKVLNTKYRISEFKLIVNQAQNFAEGIKVYKNISEVADRFLNIGIDYLGYIEWDKNIGDSIRRRRPIISCYPNSISAKNIRRLANDIQQCEVKYVATGNSQFFWQSLISQV